MLAQIFAATIFVAMFVLIVIDKIERQWITLGAGLLTIVIVFLLCMHSGTAVWETLNVASIFTVDFWYHVGEGGASSGINWETIIFIAGMMIMVEGMAKAGFFRWLCLCIAKAVNYKPVPILISFMVLSAVLSMFIDSITVILFLAAVTLELARMLDFDPVPVILAEIFCANLGGSSTMCGDPPNIIIGTSLGYTFGDFLRNTGLVALVGFVVIVVYFYFALRKKLGKGENVSLDGLDLSPASAIKNKRAFGISCGVFACAVVLLVTHATTGLTVATIGVFIAILTLVTSAKDIGYIIKRVDYKTLLFFIGLFIVVGGLEQTGVLELLAGLIGTISGGNIYVMVAIVLWLSAIASAFVDNIPFAATMVPVIRALSATQGVPLDTLAWSLALGTDIGGSATPIGASANVVGLASSAKAGHPVSWGRYCKLLVPATIIVLVICTLLLFLRYC